MPIDRSLFDRAKDPSSIILDYLEKEPEKAYTAKEIQMHIKELQDLGIPLQKITDSLQNLVESSKVEFAWVKGDVYYSVRKEEEF